MAITGAIARVKDLRNSRTDGSEASAGEVPTVQSDGKVDWQAPTEGKLILLGSASVVNTATTLSITLAMSDLYRTYKLVIEEMDSNFTHNWGIRFMNSGVQLAGANYNGHRGVRVAALESYDAQTNATGLDLLKPLFADGKGRGELTIFRPLDAEAGNPAFFGTMILSRSASFERADVAGEYNVSGQNVTGVRLFTTGGTWTARMSLYGVKNS